MDTKSYLEIREITFRAYHGVLPEERTGGQRFSATVVLYGDFLDKAASEDNLAGTIDYRRICQTVVTTATACRVDLLERLAGTIADALMEGYPLSAVSVTVSKRPPARVAGSPTQALARVYREAERS